MYWITKKINRLKQSLNPGYRSDSGIRYIFWDKTILSRYWIENFIIKKFPEHEFRNINLISVWGKRWKLFQYNGRRIFFTAENLEPIIKHDSLVLNNEFGINKTLNQIIGRYGDYMLNDVDLSLGYKNMNIHNYLRLPLWITYMVPPDADYACITEIVDLINTKKSKALRDCVVVNRHDCWGMRKKICDDLNGQINIAYAGKWRNNTDELWNEFNNDKLRYMNIFKFTICPENMDAVDYCTEKIFDAFKAGCIPIYAGCNNNPEPGIINENFIIKWNLDGDNSENIKLIRRLKNDDEFYRKWMAQDKLHPYATEYIYDRMQKLEEKLRDIL